MSLHYCFSRTSGSALPLLLFSLSFGTLLSAQDALPVTDPVSAAAASATETIVGTAAAVVDSSAAAVEAKGTHIAIDAPKAETPDTAEAVSAATDTAADAASAAAMATVAQDPLVNPLEDPPVPVDLISPGEAEPTPTESVVVNLINRLVERGVLTQGDASELVSQAQKDAAVASQNAAAAALVAADAAMATEEDIVVTHIPEPVKERLREEIKQDILTEAAEFSSAKAVTPDWEEKKNPFYGDIRVRYEATRFPDGNDNTGSFPDFDEINSGDPFDVSGFEFSPQYNVDQNRRRFRLRARLGTDFDLGDGVSVALRGGTGNDDNPISTNQTLGSNFSKYSLWLDRAYIKWDTTTPLGDASFMAGRMINPFYHTSQLMWDNDLGFDGFAVHMRSDKSEKIQPFFAAGVFPVFNTSFDFPNNRPDKFESADRYLYGAQGGMDFVLTRQVEGKFGFGYHDFDGVQAELSDPYVPLSKNDAGSTDSLRPTFAQKGNTYRPLRNIVPDPLNGFGTTDQYQYYGLASDFEILSYNAQLDLNFWEPFQVRLLGEYALNVGYDEDEISRFAVNNRGPNPAGAGAAPFDGGNQAWNIGIEFGKGVFEQKGDWNAMIGYRFVESDAVIDGFNDSNFGLGGTNVEGYTIGTAYALSPAIQLNLRWMGATEIAGPPLKSDILQFDLNAKF
jgi:hypothetical protein